jgi:endonuclease YncB( thermonuclease family)
MEQMKKLKWLIVLVGFVSFSSQATSRFSLSCPSKFIGTVTSVTDVDSSTFQKVEVSFSVVQIVKGDTFETKKIQVIKDGPVDFKAGQTYTVETRDALLCDASLLSSTN